jgi:SAM-dependent methyltransferase
MTGLAIDEAAVVRTISDNDGMFQGNQVHYFGVGRSALACIAVALQAAERDPGDIRKVLDLPCGHGRVLRYLKPAFPEAEITACDLITDGVDFCASTLGARPVYSTEDPSQIPLERDYFDLIWVGSLFSHLDAYRWHAFLEFFQSILSKNGVLVFTIHGRHAYLRMVARGQQVGITKGRQAALFYDFEQSGFGYENYSGAADYGISLSRPDWVFAKVALFPDLRIVHFAERAWDQHHDCVACVRDPGWQRGVT